MIYQNWMSYIKDDVKLKDVIIPSAHNAGTRGMMAMACCQDGTLKEQFEYGIRHYCLRLKDDRKTGKIIICHGLSKGIDFEEALKYLKEAMDENPTEFFILDIREYQPQEIGPITLRYHADPKKIDELLKKYLDPEKNALTEFNHIGDVTMGDIRKSGKRFLMINYACEYKYSVDCPAIIPWTAKRHGKRAYEFVTEATEFFDTDKTDGIYWFQTQQTPNIGVDIGMTTPRKLDRYIRWHFMAIINTIANTPRFLESANVIAGDFMTEDYFKSKEILLLNLKKDNVIADKRDEFEKELKQYA